MSLTYKDIPAGLAVPPGRVPIKVSELDPASPLTGSELFPVVQNGVLKNTTLSALSRLPTNQSPTQIEAAAPISAGMVMATNIAGKAVPAIATSVAGVRVVGLSEVTSPANVGISVTNSYLRLNDWTLATGATLLVPNTEYFLSALTAGQLVVTPPTTPGSYALSIGVAVNQETLAIKVGLPILN